MFMVQCGRCGSLRACSFGITEILSHPFFDPLQGYPDPNSGEQCGERNLKQLRLGSKTEAITKSWVPVSLTYYGMEKTSIKS